MDRQQRQYKTGASSFSYHISPKAMATASPQRKVHFTLCWQLALLFSFPFFHAVWATARHELIAVRNDDSWNKYKGILHRFLLSFCRRETGSVGAVAMVSLLFANQRNHRSFPAKQNLPPAHPPSSGYDVRARGATGRAGRRSLVTVRRHVQSIRGNQQAQQNTKAASAPAFSPLRLAYIKPRWRALLWMWERTLKLFNMVAPSPKQ